MKKILILSGVNPTTAYSCIKYLFNTLNQKYENVSIWAGVPEDAKGYKDWGENAHSFFDDFCGKIPKYRMIHMYIKGFFVALHYRNQIIICHDLYHYKSCTIVKRLFPKTRILHYCTEIFTEKNSKNQQMQQKYYLKHLDTSDLTIECDYKRSEYRKKTLGLKMPSVVILNTIPKDELIRNLNINHNANKSIPVIVYSGGVFNIHGYDIIINALKKVRHDYIMKFYVYGDNAVLDDFEKYCKESLSKGKVDVIRNTQREKLFNLISKSDIGICYYNPDYSINTKYAAPTKFFEYIGLNIPIICSNNESLAYLIDKFGLGEYMKSNDADGLATVIDLLLSDQNRRMKIRENEKKAFDEELCYEKQASEALAQIYQLIEE